MEKRKKGKAPPPSPVIKELEERTRDLHSRVQILETPKPPTPCPYEPTIGDLSGRVAKLEAVVEALNKHLADLEKPKKRKAAAEPSARERRPRKQSKKVIKVFPSQQIQAAKDVIREWKNDIYNRGLKGGQNFSVRATLPMTEEKELRDMLENESPWLAACEEKADGSPYWVLKLFCKGNHHKKKDQWISPFPEMFAQNVEESEKEE